MGIDPSTETAYEKVALLLSAETGLTFAPGGSRDAAPGIRRVMEQAGITDVRNYLDLLRTGRLSLDPLIAELTVSETYFFREPGQFQFIRLIALPEIRSRRDPEQVMRLWSAGCSSGEEAYSLAILFEEEGLLGKVAILGTDISRTKLAQACNASYTRWALRGAESLIPRYFQEKGKHYLLHERFKRVVEFRYLNLALDTYPSWRSGTWGMDLILCRNVFIYLDRKTIRRVAGKLYECLAEGGWLITAASDPPLSEVAPFNTVVHEAGVFYHRVCQAPQEAEGFERPRSPRIFPPSTGRGRGSSQPARPPVTTPAHAGGRRPAAAASDSSRDALALAQKALQEGDYARAVELTRNNTQYPEASAVHLRALANLQGPSQAVQFAGDAIRLHPVSKELHILHALLLMDLGKDREAAQAARRAIYLDRSAALAHYILGSVLRRHGNFQAARRSYRNAHEICAKRPKDEPIDFAEGETMGRLAEAAAAQLEILDSLKSDPP